MNWFYVSFYVIPVLWINEVRLSNVEALCNRFIQSYYAITRLVEIALNYRFMKWYSFK